MRDGRGRKPSIPRQTLRRGVFHSAPDLITVIEDYLGAHNQDPKPFIWTATADSILNSQMTLWESLLPEQCLAMPAALERIDALLRTLGVLRVMSVSHTWFGPGTVNTRSTRSSWRRQPASNHEVRNSRPVVDMCQRWCPSGALRVRG